MKITPLHHWIAACLNVEDRQLTRELIAGHQLEKLKETVARARVRSRFYRERLAGLPEDALHSLSDLGRFPFTTPEDLREDPGRFLCVSQDEVSRIVTQHTSGTTGSPKRVYFSKEDQERTVDFFHHGMGTLAGSGDRILILMPGEKPGSVGDLLAIGLERLGAEGVRHGFVKDPYATLEVMERERFEVLVGVPTQVLALAKASGGGSAPRSVLLSTDHVPDSLVHELRRLWRCEVFNHYGMTETGFGGGLECRAHRGYHMREADLYFEIVRPETGEPATEGEWGEVVLTTLTRIAMPLIRYKTGDISRFIPGRCPCSTVLGTMARIASRVDSGIGLRDRGVVAMADLDEVLFPIPGVVDFSADVTLEGSTECLRMQLRTVGERRVETAAAAFEALESIPAIRSARANGSLDVELRIQRWGGFEGGTAKRAIIDGRIHGGSGL